MTNWMESEFLIIFFLNLHALSSQGQFVHITVVASHFSAIELTPSGGNVATVDTLPRFACYPSAPDDDADLSLGRQFSAVTDPRSLPGRVDLNHDYRNVKGVTFQPGADWKTDGVGVFNCWAIKWGLDSYQTFVGTFFKRNDTKFLPSDGVFTKTVNVGDVGVAIDMVAREGPDPTTNGTAVCYTTPKGTFKRLEPNPLQYTFDEPIRSSDAGIYHVFYEGEIESARGAIYELIVRDCPSGKWGPRHEIYSGTPHCLGICDKCYNGGVCEDKTGVCICPNNFKGPNCLDICRPGGGNRFGFDCEFRCSKNISDPVDACQGNLFCRPDPYGCSCDVGVKGLACDTACDVGEYGPGCTQTCHCKQGASCDRFTGECNDPSNPGCASGWSGDNCQIPDVCDAGYYGPQCTDKCHCLNDVPCDKVTGECPQRRCSPGYRVYGGGRNCQVCRGETYGLGCSEKCHCIVSACFKTTGYCYGGCNSNWAGGSCQTGITRIERGEKVNPYQPTSFTCYIHGDPLPDINDVSFSGPGASLDDGVTRSSVVANGTEMVVVFDVERVVPSGNYACKLVNNYHASLSIRADTYDLPVMGEDYLVATKINSTAVSLHWEPWFAGIDHGDRPVVAYIIYYRDLAKRWVEGSKVRVGASTTSIILNELDVDTVYEFSIAAVREGPGGEGPRTLGVQAKNAPLSKAAIIGICVGIICLLIALLVARIFIIRWKKSRSERAYSTSVTKYTATPQQI